MKRFNVYHSIIFSFIVLGLLFSTVLIQADAGPKPQIIISVKNVPQELFYMDLLVEETSQNETILDLQNYDQNMVELLKSEETNGWYPALVEGTQFRMVGDIKADESNIFSYTQSLPDTFKIILVTKSENILISEPIQTQGFLTRITFDAQSGKWSLDSWLCSFFISLIWMMIPTLLIEGLLLLLFKLYNKHNLILFLIVNVSTQVLLLGTSNYAYYKFGIFLAILTVLIDEWIVLSVETIIYSKYLTNASLKRKIFYSISANILSFIGGLFLAMQII